MEKKRGEEKEEEEDDEDEEDEEEEEEEEEDSFTPGFRVGFFFFFFWYRLRIVIEVTGPRRARTITTYSAEAGDLSRESRGQDVQKSSLP